MITAITTCMGRLSHLELTLPLMLEEFDHVVVVDWSCPENSGDWASLMGADVHYKYGERWFSAARARNWGARIALDEYICFIDADTMCAPGMGAELKSLLNPATMVLSARNLQGNDIEDTLGFIACHSDAYWRVGGYDEDWAGWAQEDIHFRAKLLFEARLTAKRLSGMSLGAITHTMADRQLNRPMPLHESAAIGQLKLTAYFAQFGVNDWLTDPRVESISHRRKQNA